MNISIDANTGIYSAGTGVKPDSSASQGTASQTLSSSASSSSGQNPGQAVHIGSGTAYVKSGDIFSGQISGFGEDGSVRILLSEGSTVEARLSSGFPLSAGQNLSFLVKSTANSQISLTPLYANLDSSSAVMKALDMAGLPTTAANARMVEAMMEQGMNINPSSLLGMSSKTQSFPLTDPRNLVLMDKMGLPVTPGNVEEFDAYMNSSYKIAEGVGSLAEGLSEIAGESLYQNKALLSIFSEAASGQLKGAMAQAMKGDSAALDRLLNIHSSNDLKWIASEEAALDEAASGHTTAGGKAGFADTAGLADRSVPDGTAGLSDKSGPAGQAEQTRGLPVPDASARGLEQDPSGYSPRGAQVPQAASEGSPLSGQEGGAGQFQKGLLEGGSGNAPNPSELTARPYPEGEAGDSLRSMSPASEGRPAVSPAEAAREGALRPDRASGPLNTDTDASGKGAEILKTSDRPDAAADKDGVHRNIRVITDSTRPGSLKASLPLPAQENADIDIPLPEKNPEKRHAFSLKNLLRSVITGSDGAKDKGTDISSNPPSASSTSPGSPASSISGRMVTKSDIVSGLVTNNLKELLGEDGAKELSALMRNALMPESLNSLVGDGALGADHASQAIQEALDYIMHDKQLPPEQLEAARKLISSRPYKALVRNQITSSLLLEPDAVGDKERVRQYYERISEASRRVSQFLENTGRGDTTLSQGTRQLSQNLNFMNDLNHVMAYMQLPLKMNSQSSHGDLYVYTSKKNLSRDDGNLSALLHLDMARLGTMDIHVSLNNGNLVKTHFIMQDESVIDFIADHLEELDRALSKRGYKVSSDVSFNQESENVPEIMFNRNGNSKLIQTTAFDVRA